MSVQNTTIPEITLPVQAKVEQFDPTLTIWYLEDAAGGRIAISNGPYVKQMVDALNNHTPLIDALVAKDEEIVALQGQIEGLQDFLKKFLDNFDVCENCRGTGTDMKLRDMCRHCHGEGHILVSAGVLYNDLRREALSILGEAK